MTRSIQRPQIRCAITRTNPRTHQIILDSLDRSPLYTGIITGIGPRYCPSIETKIIRFADRNSHQVFLEPESLHNDSVYVNGVSTSLPSDVQEAYIHTIEGLEKAQFLRHGYGIEYTACPPTQLRDTLETRAVPGLYLAGQIIGTTGYEEAAGLGLIAGANAALALKDEMPLVFRRDEANLGVMIDDLITKGAPEPYRFFTSRAEYRLLLRQDNADLRLTPRGKIAGLIDKERWNRFQLFHDGVERLCRRLTRTRVPRNKDNREILISAGIEIPSATLTCERFLTRPGITVKLLQRMILEPKLEPSIEQTMDPALTERITEQAEIRIKYAGYIERQIQQVRQGLALETARIPEILDYNRVPSLRKEAVQILSQRRPATLGQARRLPGVNPADITAILICLKSRDKRKTGQNAN